MANRRKCHTSSLPFHKSLQHQPPEMMDRFHFLFTFYFLLSVRTHPTSCRSTSWASESIGLQTDDANNNNAKLKAKMSLHSTMQLVVQLHAFLTFALDRGKWLALCPGRWVPEKRTLLPLREQFGLDVAAKGKILPCQQSKPGRPVSLHWLIHAGS